MDAYKRITVLRYLVLASIRAYGEEEVVIRESLARIDRYSRSAHMFYNLNRYGVARSARTVQWILNVRRRLGESAYVKSCWALCSQLRLLLIWYIDLSSIELRTLDSPRTW